MPDGPNPGQSYESWIESKAGACPPCADCNGSGLVGELQDCVTCGGTGACPPEVDGGLDWPQPSPPPWPADDEDDEAPDE